MYSFVMALGRVEHATDFNFLCSWVPLFVSQSLPIGAMTCMLFCSFRCWWDSSGFHITTSLLHRLRP